MQKLLKYTQFNKLIILMAGLFVLFFYNYTDARQIDYFNKPQVGLWFGVLTPVYTTYDQVQTSLGGGGFVRVNSPLSNVKFGLDSSYQYYDPKPIEGVNTLTLVPVYGNLLYRIPMPWKLPFVFQIKAGAGGCWVKIRPDRVNQWDPMAMAGFEFSFGAGRRINIGFRIDYLLIYEQHIKGAERNGHVINTGLTLYFNI
ncbi:MAG: outer membrane beta-barrel protein [Spirochaetes bacterium]|nr:outer membrane beta-barrel protein [Spirochaetota bacterium]